MRTDMKEFAVRTLGILLLYIEDAHAARNAKRPDSLQSCLSLRLKRVLRIAIDKPRDASMTDLPPEKWTPGYAVFRSACSGVM
jgi:hypothetical protein